MVWWIVLAVVVIVWALLAFRRARSRSASHHDLDALRRTRGNAEKWGAGGP